MGSSSVKFAGPKTKHECDLTKVNNPEKWVAGHPHNLEIRDAGYFSSFKNIFEAKKWEITGLLYWTSHFIFQAKDRILESRSLWPRSEPLHSWDSWDSKSAEIFQSNLSAKKEIKYLTSGTSISSLLILSMTSWGCMPSTVQPTDWAVPRISLTVPTNSRAMERSRMVRAIFRISSNVMLPLCLTFCGDRKKEKLSSQTKILSCSNNQVLTN